VEYQFVGGQFVISIHQIVHGFTPLAVQNQYVVQGMGGRLSVAEDAPWGAQQADLAPEPPSATRSTKLSGKTYSTFLQYHKIVYIKKSFSEDFPKFPSGPQWPSM